MITFTSGKTDWKIKIGINHFSAIVDAAWLHGKLLPFSLKNKELNMIYNSVKEQEPLTMHWFQPHVFFTTLNTLAGIVTNLAVEVYWLPWTIHMLVRNLCGYFFKCCPTFQNLPYFTPHNPQKHTIALLWLCLPYTRRKDDNDNHIPLHVSYMLPLTGLGESKIDPLTLLELN